jgi:hypothetical protein
MLSLTIVGVSAYVYESAQQSVTQTIVEIATIVLKTPALGSINEGETQTYTNATVANLGDAIAITTTKTNVKLHLTSNLASMSTYYSTYDIGVKLVEKPAGSSLVVGTTYCTLSVSNPDYSSINLDAIGTYKFNFEIATTAKSVDSDTDTNVTINVSAEST